MKMKFPLALLFMVCLSTLSSCDKKEEDTTPEVPVPTVTAMIDASSFSTNVIVYEVLDDVHVFICTSATTGEVLTFKLDNLEVGEHMVDFDVPTVTFSSGGNMYDQFPAPIGKITVTEKTAYRVSGTFNSSVTDITNTGATLVISEGVFSNIEY